MLLWGLRYTKNGKQLNAAMMLFFSLTACQVLRHAADKFAAFVRYVIKHLFHENLSSITF